VQEDRSTARSPTRRQIESSDDRSLHQESTEEESTANKKSKHHHSKDRENEHDNGGEETKPKRKNKPGMWFLCMLVHIMPRSWLILFSVEKKRSDKKMVYLKELDNNSESERDSNGTIRSDAYE
jgi:hypothetical protein